MANDFWRFLREEKKWWLTPLVIVLLIALALVLVGVFDSGLQPFAYPDR